MPGTGYRWLVAEDAFVLVLGAKPTATYVTYERGAWQATMDGTYMKDFDFESPAAAMDYVNEEMGVDAPYDANAGTDAIVAHLEEEVRRGLDTMVDANLAVQSALSTLAGVRKDLLPPQAHLLVQDQLHAQFQAADTLTQRLKRWMGKGRHTEGK